MPQRNKIPTKRSYFLYMLFIVSHLGKHFLLRERQTLDYNYYFVPIQIQDRHGLGSKHVLSVRICDCTTPSECRMSPEPRDVKPNVVLGKWAILSMALGAALLLCKYSYLEYVC